MKRSHEAKSVQYLLDQFQQNSRRQRIQVLVGLVTLWILSIAAVLFYVPVSDSAQLDGGHLLAALCALCIFGSIPLCILLSLPSGPNRLMLVRIARNADVSAVGPIIDLVEEIQLDDTRNALRRALIKLLPTVESNDACSINSRQLHKLHVVLEGASKTHPSELQVRYCIAILKAMEHIGDGHSLMVIRKLTMRTADNERRARIQTAAVECLPGLETRLSNCKDPGNLLRATEGVLSNERLLIPKGSSHPDAEFILLRSAGNK